MSRIYEALRKLESERRPTGPGQVEANPAPPPAPTPAATLEAEFLHHVVPEAVDLASAPNVQARASMASRLVSLADPQSLGAEKFRALATRLENLRSRKELKSLQVTSSMAHEGKTLVSTNLALTFAQSSGSRILLVEGDLHTASLAPVLGLTGLHGISHWWSGEQPELSSVICRVNHLPLWFLPAGSPCEQPSNILQSPRFAEALLRLLGSFDWIIVDTPPLLPFVDANLWSRLVDGTLLVVREGVASVKALKKGIEAIDNLNLVGVVLNDASELDDPNYHYYYAQQ